MEKGRTLVEKKLTGNRLGRDNRASMKEKQTENRMNGCHIIPFAITCFFLLQCKPTATTPIQTKPTFTTPVQSTAASFCDASMTGTLGSIRQNGAQWESPDKCMKYFCTNGNVIPQKQVCCNYNGIMRPVGATINDGCKQCTCVPSGQMNCQNVSLTNHGFLKPNYLITIALFRRVLASL